MKPKYSEQDTRGQWLIDCSECVRGVNGDMSCAAGSKPKFKKGGHGGCFMGMLLPKFMKEGTNEPAT